jgi:hypothetical protein
MAKKTQPTGEQAVAMFLETSEHPLRAEMIELRSIILAADPGLSEHIKWNAPSFCANGDDRFTFKLNSPKAVEIVFHRGTKVKVMPGARLIEDPNGLLKWVTNDRAVASFAGMDEIQEKREALTDLIRRWISASAESPVGE